MIAFLQEDSKEDPGEVFEVGKFVSQKVIAFLIGEDNYGKKKMEKSWGEMALAFNRSCPPHLVPQIPVGGDSCEGRQSFRPNPAKTSEGERRCFVDGVNCLRFKPWTRYPDVGVFQEYSNLPVRHAQGAHEGQHFLIWHRAGCGSLRRNPMQLLRGPGFQCTTGQWTMLPLNRMSDLI